MPTPAHAHLGLDRHLAVQAIIGQIERRYGRGTIWRLDPTQPLPPAPVIPTGCLPLDLALGVGGLPRGRISELYGPEATGKTTLALTVIAQGPAGRWNGPVHRRRARLDPIYAQAVGVKLERLLICQPDSGEHAWEVLDTLVRSGALDVAVIDSLPGPGPPGRAGGEVGDHYTSVYGRLMAQAMRKLTGPLAKTRTVLVLANQLRETPGVLFGSPERVPGGRALRHHATVRLDLRVRERLKDGGRVVGDRIRVRVVKNTVAVPFRTAELDLLYGRGFLQTPDGLRRALASARRAKTGAAA